MIFLVVGVITTGIGLTFFLFPSQKENFIYGYRTYLSKQSESHWRYAQRTSALFFLLFGSFMVFIGTILKLTDNTHFFLAELLLVPWFIAPMFGCIETKLKKFDQNYRGERNEYLND